jgi:hypothetical protein
MPWAMGQWSETAPPNVVVWQACAKRTSPTQLKRGGYTYIHTYIHKNKRNPRVQQN